MDPSALLGAIAVVAAADPTANKVLGLSIAAGLGTIGPGIGVGYIFGKTIESITRQPELRSQIMGTTWLGFALTEAIVFYALVTPFIATLLA